MQQCYTAASFCCSWYLKSTLISLFLYFLFSFMLNGQALMIWLLLLLYGFFNWQVTNNSTRSAAAKITIHGFISSYMGRGFKLEIHARMPLLYLSSCMYSLNCSWDCNERKELAFLFHFFRALNRKEMYERFRYLWEQIQVWGCCMEVEGTKISQNYF